MSSDQLIFLSATSPAAPMRALQEIAGFLGLPCRSAQLAPANALLPEQNSACLGWVLDVADLAKLDENTQEQLVEKIARCHEPLLLLVTAADARTHQLLARLSGDAIRSIVVQDTASETAFEPNTTEICRELSGVTFKRASGPALGMTTSADQRTQGLMRVGKDICFLTWDERRRKRFAWSTTNVFDTKHPLLREVEFEQSLDAVIPAVIFLRVAFPEQCWHNPERTAGFVIDDPLLTRRYGFIDFPRLLESARREAYHVSLAFIPWNAWRTRKGNATWFRNHSDVFSLCIHGCDHNNNEYGSADYELLLEKNHIALSRMERHTQRTGLNCAPVAVCPQEQCSLPAWKAFADTPGILAMTNTGCLARNVENTRVCAQDLLLPAQDALYGFPVFKRHYSGDHAAFALALFLGRPAILVEHHAYFREGLKSIEKFVRDLRQTCPSVTWPKFYDIFTSAHLRRTTLDGTTEVRFFTNHFRLDRPEGERNCFHLRKRVYNPSSVRSVSVDGEDMAFAFDGDFLTFELISNQPTTHNVRVNYSPSQVRRTYSFGPTYQSKVAFRRTLSEARDNIFSRHEGSTALAKKIVEALHLTGSTARK